MSLRYMDIIIVEGRIWYSPAPKSNENVNENVVEGRIAGGRAMFDIAPAARIRYPFYPFLIRSARSIRFLSAHIIARL